MWWHTYSPTCAASPSVSNWCSNGSARSPNDDMNHQEYTHVIHPATPVFAGVSDDPDQKTSTDTGGHQRTPDGRSTVTKVTYRRTVPVFGTRSAAEDSQRCAGSVSSVSLEFVPDPMLAGEQLLACANAAAVLRGQFGSESEWIADQREKEHEVETLCCRRIVDRDGEGFGDDSSEQRRPRDMTGSGG